MKKNDYLNIKNGGRVTGVCLFMSKAAMPTDKNHVAEAVTVFGEVHETESELQAIRAIESSCLNCY